VPTASTGLTLLPPGQTNRLRICGAACRAILACGEGSNRVMTAHLQPLYAEASRQLGAQPQAGAQPHGEQTRLVIV